MTRSGRKIKADGDRWAARLSETPPSPDVQAVVFFCVSTGQRPYRVVEVSREALPDEKALEGLSREKLEELFRDSRSMGFPHSFPNPAASGR